MVNTATAVAAAGSAILLADYLDRRLSLTRDIGTLRRMARFKMDANNAAKGEYSIVNLWDATVAKHAKRPMVVFEGTTYTFDAIDKLSNRIAHAFIAAGLRKGDVVALYMENCPEFFAVWLGVAKAAGATAFINYNLTGKSLLHCLTIAKAKFVVFGHDLEASIAEVAPSLSGVALLDFGGSTSYAANFGSAVERSSDAAPDRSVRKGVTANDTWGFVYTSGTTGLPKAAAIKHLRFLMAASGYSNLYDVTSADRIYTVLPLYHSAGGMIGAGMVIYTGACMILRKKFSATAFFREARESKATVFQYIGELCRYLLATEPSPDDTRHALRIGIGNGLRPDIWEKFQKRFNILEMGEFYAATEGNCTLFNRVDQSGVGVGGVGHMGWLLQKVNPVRIVKFNVETEELVRGKDGLCIECGVNEAGELVGYIDPSDPTRDFAGYYGNKAGTDKKIATDVFAKGDRWFRSGDLLRRDERGFFYFVDRIGDTFRWKGENVSTNEVAEAIATFPGIQEANVYGVEVPGKDGRAGMAAIVVHQGSTVDYAALGAHIAKQLPSYAVPIFLRILPAMELTGTFKHRKVELRSEGIDLAKVADPLFMFNPASKAYEPFGQAQYADIVGGKAKL